MTKLHVAYGDVYLDWKLGSSDFEHPLERDPERSVARRNR